ncbi:fatty acyl-AMP ligase [Mycobacterium montefiorense]|uniref:fatty acyl-AMP ligase n=2 Tax=Mycobacterium montefiorense TaxID=154654 RepID=UPI0021F330CB|nr:fatty acyl-AMP ligase [Mycobacterium montefiorense]MCV7429340.1 fatty acyl-AMP ligase [Mycobacterium montefiorense]
MSGSSAPVSLVQALQRNAERNWRGFTFVSGDRCDTDTFVSFTQLKESVARAAAALRARGVRQGNLVALIVPDAQEFVTSFLAAVWAGAVPVPLYPPVGLGSQQAYLDYICGLMDAASVDGLIIPQWLDDALGLGERFQKQHKPVAHADALDVGEDLLEPVVRGSDQPVFLQFTSGSTGRPKAVVVKDKSLWTNAGAFVSALGCTDRDHAVSWLPLYHDTGLIGKVLAPLLFSVEVTFLPTLSFLRDPGVWLDVISRKRATLSFAPNFAYALVAKRAKPRGRAWDLSSMRAFGCGAEPINAETLDLFIDTFAPYGLPLESIMPAYGMAEATLAVTFDRLDRRFTALKVGADAYHADGEIKSPVGDEKTLSFVNCGKVFEGHSIRITDDQGIDLPPGRVGDVEFRGPSLAAGYYHDEAATRATFRDDRWLVTGDRGFVVDGDLYVTGRKKDILIVNGRNYDPHHVEWAAADVPGIRKGNVVAFSVPSDVTEKVVVVAEGVALGDNHHQQVRRAVYSQTRLAIDELVLLEPGQLPKTSSGKVQRSRTRDLYLTDALEDVAVATRTHAHTGTAGG